MQVSATSNSCHPLVLQRESSGLKDSVCLGAVLQQALADSSSSLVHAVPSIGIWCQTACCPKHNCMVWDGLSSTRGRLCHLNKHSTKHPAHPIFMIGAECYVPHALRQAFGPSAAGTGSRRRPKTFAG